jgi:hypothetical protein
MRIRAVPFARFSARLESGSSAPDSVRFSWKATSDWIAALTASIAFARALRSALAWCVAATRSR